MDQSTLIRSLKTLLKGLVVLLLPFSSWGQCPPPVVNFTDSITFCQGNFITLDATNPGATYVWSTNATTGTINVSTSGTYWVQVTDSCGTASDTIKVNVDEPVMINLGPNRNVCSDSTTVLSAPLKPRTSYTWQDNSSSNTFTVTSPGTYYVSAQNACGTFTDTVTLGFVSTPSVNLGADILNCTGQPDTLQITAGPQDSVQWSDGSSGNSFIADTAGTYWVYVSNACGVFSDTVDISYNQVSGIELGDTIFKCPGDTAIISSNVSGGNYSWSTGSQQSFAVAVNPGLYYLTFSNSCGSFSDSVYVRDKEAFPDLGPDTAVCGAYLLDPGTFSGATYTWSTGSPSPFIYARDTGTYYVGVNIGCGFKYDTIYVRVDDIPEPKQVIPDTSYLCAGDSIRIDAGGYGFQTTYFWSTGETSREVYLSQVGTYSVEVRNNCDTASRTFYIASIDPKANLLPADTFYCSSSVVLTSLSNFSNAQYYWSNNGRGRSERFTSSGTYWLQVFTPCDTLSDTINVTLSPDPAVIPEDTLKFCSNSFLIIKPEERENAQYIWSDNSTNDSLVVNTSGKYWYTAFGACDTVSDTVYAIEEFPLNVDLGPDTNFCEPNFYLLDYGGLEADSVYWSTGSSDTAIVIDTTGSFYVELYNSCGMFSDSIEVQVDLLPDRIIEDTSFCYNSSVTVSAQQPQVHTYYWSTGESTPSITINQEGEYYVDMTSNCGTVTDTFQIGRDTIISPFSLGPDTALCGPSLVLDPGNIGGTHYTWQDSIPGRSLEVFSSGTYYLEARNACNTQYDTIDVIITGPPQLLLGDEVRFCDGTSITLNAQNPLLATYQWNTGDTTQLLTVDSAGTYWVTITNNCGQKTDTIDVIVEFPLDSLDIGPDTTVCLNDSLVLGTPNPAADALWSTGATTDSIVVDTTGEYWVRKTNSCGSFFDTIFVEVLRPFSFSLGKDSAFCEEDTNNTFSGPGGFRSYVWSTGDSTRSIRIDTAADYWLTASNGCFSYTDTVRLVPERSFTVDLGNDTSLCFGQSLFLDPTQSDNEVIWHDGTIDSIKEITRSGVYWAFGSNSCGAFHDTIRVDFDVPLSPPEVDTSFCRGDTLTLDFSDYEVEVEWPDGSNDYIKKFVKEDTIQIKLTNTCGTYEQRINMIMENCSCPFHIPNAFTPNGNGVNDEFRIKHACNLVRYEIEIMDRIGRKVFSSSDIDRSWDGRIGNDAAPEGIYVYKVNYSWEVDGVVRVREEEGVLTLVR